MKHSLFDASCRVALAAYLHDLGKFAERAKIEVSNEQLETHKQLYARRHEAGGKFWYSHIHSAYTAIAWDIIEQNFPNLVGIDNYPFGSWKDVNVDDSMINTASKHHKPDTFLQWIVATADRVASGFEREEFEKYNDPQREHNDKTQTGKNHYTARQLSLFEQIRLSTDEKNEAHKDKLNWRYPLKPLSVASLFPKKATECEPNSNEEAQQEYHQLWDEFSENLDKIPPSHRSNWRLWMEHFDSAWCTFTHSIPAATAFNVRPEVSLYDHSRTTAAVATGLWRYHEELQHEQKNVKKKLSDFSRPDWDEQKLLLIQGDFFGIQNFIFASGGATNKNAAKLLRGRSFYVSLLTECAALKILTELGLPATSQVTNAAGKFLIVAPNTPQTIETLKKLQQEIQDWFLSHTYGRSGIGFTWLPAACNDFLSNKKDLQQSPFARLIEQLFENLNTMKAQRFDLCSASPAAAVFEDFLNEFENDKGVCSIDGVSPAKVKLRDSSEHFVSVLAKDQIKVGEYLTNNRRVLISRSNLNHNTLKLGIFGFFVQFTGDEVKSGRFGEVAKNGQLLSAWDFGIAAKQDEILFNGYSRRFINSYVPVFQSVSEWDKNKEKYKNLDLNECQLNENKSFEFIACDDRRPVASGEQYEGVSALCILKGDVDNLGSIFEKGLQKPSFAKMSSLSRQLNAFFAVWLPWFCKKHYPDTYTVFAGGDDFFLIGPWKQTIKLTMDMQQHFEDFVAHNPEIHFSAGLSFSKPGIPVPQMAEMAEEALEQAKARKENELIVKNAVTCFGYTVSWTELQDLWNVMKELESLKRETLLSTSYVYGLQYLADMAEDLKSEKPNVESALWNSRFNYRTWRMLERTINNEQSRNDLHKELGSLIGGKITKYGAAFKIALFIYLYTYRD